MTTQLLLSNAPHHNQRLFSDYFLDHKLPEEWNSLWEEAALAMGQMEQLAHTFLPIAKNANEAQTEYSWIRPILQILGHVFEVQSSLKTPDGVQRPDYFFYLNNTVLEVNKGKILTENDLKQGGYAVGDAKSWERSLDQTIKHQEQSKPLNERRKQQRRKKMPGNYRCLVMMTFVKVPAMHWVQSRQLKAIQVSLF